MAVAIYLRSEAILPFLGEALLLPMLFPEILPEKVPTFPITAPALIAFSAMLALSQAIIPADFLFILLLSAKEELKLDMYLKFNQIFSTVIYSIRRN